MCVDARFPFCKINAPLILFGYRALLVCVLGGVAQEKLHLQLTRERLEQYQIAFRKIQEETGETSIDRLVSNFIEGEKNIDWLMKCVSDINKEIDALNSQIKEGKCFLITIESEMK